MNVSQETIDAFNSASVKKKLNVKIGGKKVPMKNIVSESMSLKESLMATDNVEFVGCIASQFEIDLHGNADYKVARNYKGKQIVVSITVDDDRFPNVETIPLFHGIVDSCTITSNRQSRNIKAYDILYTKGQEDIAFLYNEIPFPVTIKYIRDHLFQYLGIQQVTTTLPNDNIVIDKQYDPKTLRALDVIKAICQFNGCMGIINRSNKFEYRFISDFVPQTEHPYPSWSKFPDDDVYPTSPDEGEFYSNSVLPIEPTYVPNYQKVIYQDYTVKPINKVIIRESEKDPNPIEYGSGSNKYIIQNNMFAYKLSPAILLQVAGRIYQKVEGFSFSPFTAQNPGMPWLEIGKDAVTYSMYDF